MATKVRRKPQRAALEFDPSKMRVNGNGRVVWKHSSEFVKGVRAPAELLPKPPPAPDPADPAFTPEVDEEIRRTFEGSEVFPAPVEELEEAPPAPPPADPPPPAPEPAPAPPEEPAPAPAVEGGAIVEELEAVPDVPPPVPEEPAPAPLSGPTFGPPHSRCHRCAARGEQCPCCAGMVYPAVSEKEAEAYADLLAPMISRASRHPTPFTEEERERFSGALKMVAERRAGFLSAYSDLILLGAAVGMPMWKRKDPPSEQCACGVAIVSGYKFCTGCGSNVAGTSCVSGGCVTEADGTRRGARVPRGAKHCPNCGVVQTAAA